MSLPLDLLWGVDVAIKKLRPGANFQLEGTSITVWNCPNNSTPPTWDEVVEQLQKDEAAADEWLKNNQ